MFDQRTYASWHGMIYRCTVNKSKDFENYGGRGIRVCTRWLTSYDNFVSDMGYRPKDKTLDRINNEGDYEPSNCCWSTSSEQASNRRVKTHCIYGHELNTENVITYSSGRRECRECKKSRNRSASLIRGIIKEAQV